MIMNRGEQILISEHIEGIVSDNHSLFCVLNWVYDSMLDAIVILTR